jgi:hypothetical protein
MFVRFRQTKRRLQVSLGETRRAKGRVRHEHIASLGTVEVPLTVRGRVAFWHHLHERLTKLSNRLDTGMQAKVLGDVHARVPMVTVDEQREVKVENAEADERLWSALHEMHKEQSEGHKQIVVEAQGVIAKSQSAAAEAAAKAAEAKERAERLKRGEDAPGGLGKPLDVEKTLREMGFKTADLNHGRTIGALREDAIPVLVREGLNASERAIRPVGA